MKQFFLFFTLLLSCSALKDETLPKKSLPSHITLSEVEVKGSLQPLIQEEERKFSREELLMPLLSTLDQFCEEKPIFDEPRNEIGQEDGSLRPKWLKFYQAKKKWFTFFQPETGAVESHAVFGKDFAPIPPQVCADLITDSLERASGTWFRNDPKNPGREIGSLEIRDSAKELGFDVRRIFELVAFMKTQPENFQFLFDGFGPRVGKLKQFKYWLKEKDVRVGDVIIVSGKAPWDFEEKNHQHSMFVRELDKDGMVRMIVGNSDWVQKRSLAIEVSRAPKRRVVFVIRLTDHFLESLRK